MADKRVMVLRLARLTLDESTTDGERRNAGRELAKRVVALAPGEDDDLIRSLRAEINMMKIANAALQDTVTAAEGSARCAEADARTFAKERNAAKEELAKAKKRILELEAQPETKGGDWKWNVHMPSMGAETVEQYAERLLREASEPRPSWVGFLGRPFVPPRYVETLHNKPPGYVESSPPTRSGLPFDPFTVGQFLEPDRGWTLHNGLARNADQLAEDMSMVVGSWGWREELASSIDEVHVFLAVNRGRVEMFAVLAHYLRARGFSTNQIQENGNTMTLLAPRARGQRVYSKASEGITVRFHVNTPNVSLPWLLQDKPPILFTNISSTNSWTTAAPFMIRHGVLVRVADMKKASNA